VAVPVRAFPVGEDAPAAVAMIAYGCCVGSWDRFRRYVMRGDDQLLYATSGHRSIVTAYNGVLDAATGMGDDLTAVVLQHDDLEITDPGFEDKVRRIVREYPFSVAGIAGGDKIHGLDWWNATTYGWQRIATQDLHLGPREGRVQLLEGSLLILSAELARALRFDPRFTGFHGYDEFTYQAYKIGADVRVVDIDTFHHTTLGFSSPASEAAWVAANQRFKEKWNL
jgi:hypothetical protein